MPLRLSALDHLRGLGILLVFLFSFWYWLYPGGAVPALIEHNVPGQVHAGDFVFALFIFCSGVSLWFFCARARQTRVPLDSALGRYLRLLGLALLISATRLFVPFPDEVLIIALSALIALLVVWLGRPLLSGLWALAVVAVFSGLKFGAPAFWSSLTAPYLGGFTAVFYYSLLTLAAAIISARAFPRARLEPGSIPSLWNSWGWALAGLALTLPLGLPDKVGLSFSFLALSLAIFIPLLVLAIRIFDAGGLRLPLAGRIGASSLAGWAVFYAVSALVWYRDWGNRLDPSLYVLFCAALYVLLALALHLLDFARERLKNGFFAARVRLPDASPPVRASRRADASV
ncbi:Uncharacterised protein [uncultured archaeon]|nr:Uncharacterised protein [uncultured archaeon]